MSAGVDRELFGALKSARLAPREATAGTGILGLTCPECRTESRYTPATQRWYCLKSGCVAGDRADLLARANRLVASANGTGSPAPTAGPNGANSNGPGPRLVIRWMSDVAPKPVDWIWPRWLARRKLHVFGGLGGIGKGTIMAALAAQLSTGRGSLPDGSPAPLVKTLFLLSEDAPDDTLWPRLDVHGADKRSIAHVEAVRSHDGRDAMLHLGRHLDLIEGTIADDGFGLVVVDALSDFMAGADRNSEGEVRDLLTPVGQMAARTGAAVVGVMHPGKGNQDLRGFQRLLGASAFGNLARVVWLAGDAPDGSGRMLLGVDKSNLAIKPPALEWSRSEDAPIVWHGPSAHKVGDVFGASAARPRDDAQGFLRELLRGGQVESERVKATAEAAGISWATVRRAKEALGVESFRQGYGTAGGWFWRLPQAPSDAPPAGDSPKVLTPIHTQVSTFDTSLSTASKVFASDEGEHR